MLGDVPDPPDAVATSSPAIDYDTNHGFQLSPARLMNIFDQLGFTGPLNEYVGVFWWNQRKAVGAVFGSATVTLGGTFVAGDQVLLFIGTAAPNNNVGKTVFANESNTIIAAHLAYFVNETFSGVWASTGVDSGGNPTITITSRSPAAAYNFTFSASVELVTGSTGTIAVTGSLSFGSRGLRRRLGLRARRRYRRGDREGERRGQRDTAFHHLATPEIWRSHAGSMFPRTYTYRSEPQSLGCRQLCRHEPVAMFWP